MSHQDDVFVRLFIGLLVILTLFTIGAIILGNMIGDLEQESVAGLAQQGSTTTAPAASAAAPSPKKAGAGDTGPEMDEEMADAGAESGAPEAAMAATDEAAGGNATYTKACYACHGTGAVGAPITGKQDQWADRIAKGTETLYDHAINGFNAMPAKGGWANLSDAEVKAAVDYMVDESR